ncbi:MAG TPA: hypothetical protein VFG69_19310 [Nannocystaceae bacterium]|nr:hypothetical protein [Nannocystaceae bacterium]
MHAFVGPRMPCTTTTRIDAPVCRRRRRFAASAARPEPAPAFGGDRSSSCGSRLRSRTSAIPRCTELIATIVDEELEHVELARLVSREAEALAVAALAEVVGPARDRRLGPGRTRASVVSASPGMR